MFNKGPQEDRRVLKLRTHEDQQGREEFKNSLAAVSLTNTDLLPGDSGPF